MNRRIAIKRIKYDALTQMWLQHWVNSIKTIAHLQTEQKQRKNLILEYAIHLNARYAEYEIKHAYNNIKKKCNIKEKIFRKIIYSKYIKNY